MLLHLLLMPKYAESNASRMDKSLLTDELLSGGLTLPDVHIQIQNRHAGLFDDVLQLPTERRQSRGVDLHDCVLDLRRV